MGHWSKNLRGRRQEWRGCGRKSVSECRLVSYSDMRRNRGRSYVFFCVTRVLIYVHNVGLSSLGKHLKKRVLELVLLYWMFGRTRWISSLGRFFYTFIWKSLPHRQWNLRRTFILYTIIFIMLYFILTIHVSFFNQIYLFSSKRMCKNAAIGLFGFSFLWFVVVTDLSYTFNT